MASAWPAIADGHSASKWIPHIALLMRATCYRVHFFRTWAAGASGTRHSLRPHWTRASVMHRPRSAPRDRAFAPCSQHYPPASGIRGRKWL